MVNVRKKVEDALLEALNEKLQDLFGEDLSDYSDVDEAVEKLLTPDNEGYAYTYAEIVEDVIREITGRRILCWPLAEGWTLLLTEGKTFLGTVPVEGAPYCGFDRLVKAVEEVLETLKKIGKEKPINYYELTDEEGSYGIVATSLSREEFEKLVEEYKATDEYYNNEDLIEFLKEKGIEAELIEPEEVYF